MSTISFIATTYNVAPYLEKCLSSLAAVARPGDEIILVDDGSTDGSDEIVRRFTEANGFPEGVEFVPIFLGTNTHGGVGIGANIGLSAATRHSIFFVDGDDWIDAEGFNRARAYWTAHGPEILVTNYLEYDQGRDSFKRPADSHRWRTLDRTASLERLRMSALGLIAVPWRKFYRRDFIEHNRIRFPEGDFFFEDNPFHWEVCLKAKSIGFVDLVTCFHRINRPGQTMASTGIELVAFFTHFTTILQKLPSGRRELQATAARWLLSNMTWHMERLSPSAYFAYATQAAKALAKIEDSVWNEELYPTEYRKSVWPVASRLRSGDVWGQIDSWETRSHKQMLVAIGNNSEKSAKAGDTIKNMFVGHGAATVFEAISTISDQRQKVK